jgi:hypothetical protein
MSPFDFLSDEERETRERERECKWRLPVWKKHRKRGTTATQWRSRHYKTQAETNASQEYQEPSFSTPLSFSRSIHPFFCKGRGCASARAPRARELHLWRRQRRRRTCRYTSVCRAATTRLRRPLRGWELEWGGAARRRGETLGGG